MTDSEETRGDSADFDDALSVENWDGWYELEQSLLKSMVGHYQGLKTVHEQLLKIATKRYKSAKDTAKAMEARRGDTQNAISTGG